MVKENKLAKLMTEMDLISKYEIYNSKSEEEIIRKIGDVFTLQKKIKETEIAVNNSDLTKLIVNIDNLCLKYENDLKEMKNAKDFDSNKILDLNSKLGSLKYLSIEMKSYCNKIIEEEKIKQNKLIDEIMKSLVDYPLDFNNLFIKFKSMEKLDINLTDLIKNSRTIDDLEEGFEIIRNGQNKERLVNLCNKILSSRDKVYSNLSDIIRINQLEIIRGRLKEEVGNYEELVNELNTTNLEIEKMKERGYKRALDHRDLKKLYLKKNQLLKSVYENYDLPKKKEIADKDFKIINKRLINNNLDVVLYNATTNLKLHLKDDESLSIDLKDIRKRKDLDTFYNDVTRVLKDNISYLKVKYQFIKNKFMNRINPKTKVILTKYPDMAQNLIQLGKVGRNDQIDSSFGLFVLQSLITAKDSTATDFNISNIERSKLTYRFNEQIDYDYEMFLDQCVSIINNKSKEKVLEKIR